MHACVRVRCICVCVWVWGRGCGVCVCLMCVGCLCLCACVGVCVYVSVCALVLCFCTGSWDCSSDPRTRYMNPKVWCVHFIQTGGAHPWCISLGPRIPQRSIIFHKSRIQNLKLKVCFHTSFRSTLVSWRTKIAQSQWLAISALTEPNRQISRRKNGFWARKSQLEIANR